MAGRIRTIKPELLDDERAAELSDAAWRLFVSSWLLADDHGNFRAGGKYLAAQVWQDTSRDADGPLAELARSGRVELYEVDGQRYAHIPTWRRHQRIDNAGKPRVPVPTDTNRILSDRFAEIRGESREVAATLGKSPLDLRPPTSDLRPTTTNDPGQAPTPEPTQPPEPPAVAGPGPVGPDTSEARKVFDAYVECWREHVGRGATPVLTDKRRKAIRARIAEHGAKAVECAARGIWASDWHRENGQTSLDLAMRDAAHVERFALLVAPPAQRAPWVEPEPPPFTFARPVDGPPVEPVGDLAALLKLASGL